MENRVREYQYDYFLSGFNYMSEARYEEWWEKKMYRVK
jgi:hypothetical protein